MFKEFRKRFWRPPRAHGEIIEDRSVSFLELFYDLVYVVVVAAAASTLAHDITWRSVGEFAVVFGLIWLAWTNSTILHALHGNEDLRTRTFIFAPMLLLVWLAVYVGDAGQDGGQGCALIYAGYFTLLTWLWFTVRRQDDGVFDVSTRRYLAVMVLIVATMIGSAWLPAAQRVLVWALVIVIWMVSALVISRTTMDTSAPGFFVGDSLVERFGLFTIIVLGEVVVGVVDGLRNVVSEPLTVATGLVALTIGFGLWWNYFDLTRGRHPREQPTGISIWMFVHLPLTMSIAAAGAAMVVVVEHASEDRTPAGASWLLTAAVAMGLVSLAGVVRTLEAYESLRVIYGPTSRVMVVAAASGLFPAASVSRAETCLAPSAPRSPPATVNST